jgi:hypothetical protein
MAAVWFIDLTLQFLCVVRSIRCQDFINLGQLGWGAAIGTVLKKALLEMVDGALSHGQSSVATIAPTLEPLPG